MEVNRWEATGSRDGASVVVALLVAVGVASGGCREQPQRGVLEVNDSELVTLQDAGERVVVADLNELYPYEVVYDDSVALNPREVAVSAYGVLVLDLPARVVVLDTSRRFIGHVGGSTGRGPGELLRPIAVGWTTTGNIAIADRGNRRLLHLNIDGSLVQELGLPDDFVDFGFIDDDHFVMHTVTQSQPVLFSALQTGDTLVSEVSEFGWLVSEPSPRAGLAQGGRLAVVEGSDSFVFTPLNAGRLARFRWSGERDFYRQTVDGTNYARVVRVANRGWTLSPEDQHGVANEVISVRDGVINVFRLGFGERGDGQNFIDRYKSSNGEYIDSIRIRSADACGPLFVDSREVWLACSGTLVRRSRKTPENRSM